MTETILLLEDDTTLLWANQGFLEMAGLEVLACTTVQEAREAVWERMPDLMILDVMLPDGSGVDFCREYRDYYGNGTPVLFLTVLEGQEDMLAGYEAGGADYLVKPFDLDILLLKVRALLQNKKAAAEMLQLGSLYLNCRTHIAYLDGMDLILTPKEFSLLEFLVRNRGTYLPARTLYEAVWGSRPFGERTIKEHIRSIRRKLGGYRGIEIESQWGEGYRLVRHS